MKRQLSIRERIPQRLTRSLLFAFGCSGLIGAGFAAFHVASQLNLPVLTKGNLAESKPVNSDQPISNAAVNGRPQLSPLPPAKEVWECEVVVVGGSLGGIAAASHSMKSGAKTCLIELTPWLGGQISSQGVSAIDESHTMRELQNYSESWVAFKDLIKKQPVQLPEWVKPTKGQQVADLNSCWVGKLCFLPKAGAAAAQELLELSLKRSPSSRWGTSIAFKGAEFDPTGQEITTVYAVQRQPRSADYVPQGRLSKELTEWYSWGSNETFEKTPMRLQAPAGKRLIVIDATDTGEMIGWAGIPHRLGSDAKETLGEIHGSKRDNPDCTQAFTFPFVLALHDDNGISLKELAKIKPGLSRKEHRKDYTLQRFPAFEERSFFNYRRIVSVTQNDPIWQPPAPGDMTAVNWNRGNDWTFMDPPLILRDDQIATSGQRQNWLGGLSTPSLKDGEEHALLFAEWLMEVKAEPARYPLAYLFGADSPMGTLSGLSMTPYIREGRRIVGRPAYGQGKFMMREADLRLDQPGGRDFSPTTIAVTHYDVDIHGCKYRDGRPSLEANSAPSREYNVRPVRIPLEGLIPQGVNNLLVGNKPIAVSHIANAVTRVHYGEWSTGAAAGAIAGWLVTKQPGFTPDVIVSKQLMPELQEHLISQGLRVDW